MKYFIWYQSKSVYELTKMIENLKYPVLTNDYGNAWENPEIIENGTRLNNIFANECVDLIKYIDLRYGKKKKRCRKGWKCNKKDCPWKIGHRIDGGRQLDGASDKYAAMKEWATKEKKSKAVLKNAIKTENQKKYKINDKYAARKKWATKEKKSKAVTSTLNNNTNKLIGTTSTGLANNSFSNQQNNDSSGFLDGKIGKDGMFTLPTSEPFRLNVDAKPFQSTLKNAIKTENKKKHKIKNDVIENMSIAMFGSLNE